MNEYEYRIPLFGPNYSNIRIVRIIRCNTDDYDDDDEEGLPDSPTSGVHFVNQEMMNGEDEIQEELQSLMRTNNERDSLDTLRYLTLTGEVMKETTSTREDIGEYSSKTSE